MSSRHLLCSPRGVGIAISLSPITPPSFALLYERRDQQSPGNKPTVSYCGRRFHSSGLPSPIVDITRFSAALDMLGLRERSTEETITAKVLRLAYYQAAKECHPDVASGRKNKQSGNNEDAAEQFRLVTEAYELLLLQQEQHQKQRNNSGIDDASVLDLDDFTPHSEADYREACLQWLGQPAEVVEESKRCPVFRQWLSGRTDSAYYWNMFLMLHGGLAPRLLPRQLGMKTTETPDQQHPSVSEINRQRRKRPSYR